ncbi:YidC/Oxa1 family membrane protein insertase [Peptostreptococcus faecalis]|uniref:YidC/Oxa1 family membrane protein insertase n=1 Tax=Peptostreptococcus faecalis TaxID=2045015 RepID=UPI000C7C96FA|nr:YidC/Oxa1 family membrane protein insertase [Peptostreptococcus faecalis]
MEFIANFFGAILYHILNIVGNYGFAIIIFTILVKILLTPLSIKQTKSTFVMSELSPKIKEIQEKFQNKPEKLNNEISKLYKEAKVNPLSGCLPLLIQMPIMYALFIVFKDPIAHGVFVDNATFLLSIENFLWINSLSTPDYLLAILSGISAFLMQKISTPKDQVQGPMKIMSLMVAGISVYSGLMFPAALTLYWNISNIFSVLQYFTITNPLKKKLSMQKTVKQ